MKKTGSKIPLFKSTAVDWKWMWSKEEGIETSGSGACHRTGKGLWSGGGCIGLALSGTCDFMVLHRLLHSVSCVLLLSCSSLLPHSFILDLGSEYKGGFFWSYYTRSHPRGWLRAKVWQQTDAIMWIITNEGGARGIKLEIARIGIRDSLYSLLCCVSLWISIVVVEGFTDCL